jgi:hypothetical protein
MDEPETEIKETVPEPIVLQVEGEDALRRLKGSGFALTVNTNKRPQGITPQELLQDEVFRRADLLQAIKKLIRTPRQRSSVFKFKEPFQNDKWNTTFIRRVIWDAPTTELGGHKFGGRVHGNFSVRVTHFSKIHVDRDALKDAILENLLNKDIQTLHINIRAFNLNAITLQRYFRKEEETEKGRAIANLSERLAELSTS